MCIISGALAHTILRVSYFVVVNLFTILIETYLTIQFTLIRYNYCFETAFFTTHDRIPLFCAYNFVFFVTL